VPSDDIRWLTYREMVEVLGLPSEKAAVSRSRREKWPRQINNERGLALVGVPLSVIEAAANRPPPETRSDKLIETPLARTLSDALEVELRQRAERAEAGEQRERVRAERAEDERDSLAAEIIKQRERRARAEGEAAGLKETVRLAEEGRRDMQTERDAARTELAEQRVAFQQVLSRAQKVEAERGAIAEARLLDQLAAQEAAAEAAAARSATTRAAAQVAEERAARQAAEAARDTAAVAAEVARAELAELTAGGPLRRALRAFAFRRGRP
jgi:hypothetical protein